MGIGTQRDEFFLPYGAVAGGGVSTGDDLPDHLPGESRMVIAGKGYVGGKGR